MSPLLQFRKSEEWSLTLHVPFVTIYLKMNVTASENITFHELKTLQYRARVTSKVRYGWQLPATQSSSPSSSNGDKVKTRTFIIIWPQSDHLRKLSYGWYPPPSAFLSCGNLSTFWGTFILRVFHYLRDANVESWEGEFFLHLELLHSNTVDWTRGAGFAFRFSFRKQSQRGNLEKLEKILSLDFQD